MFGDKNLPIGTKMADACDAVRFVRTQNTEKNRLRRWIAALLLLVAVCGQTALAQEGGRKKNTSPPNQIDMPFLVAPANQNETLIGFHYMSYRFVTPSPGDAAAVRLKLAILQDAFVRDVYKTPVSRPDTPDQIDRQAVHDRLIAIARRIAGSKKIVDLIFRDIKFSPLHPKPGNNAYITEGDGTGAGSDTGNNASNHEDSQHSKKKDGKP